MTGTIKARVFNAGTAEAATLVLSEPLSFWGGFDPATGIILDQHHPQKGACLRGVILILPTARGSGGTPACFAESLRCGSGPVGVILKLPEINIATGARVARTLYGANCPVVCVAPSDYDALCNSRRLAIAEDGTITLIS